MKLKELVAAAQLEHARKPNEFEMRAKLAKEDPALYAKMFGKDSAITSREEAIKNLVLRYGPRFQFMKPDEQEVLIKQETSGGTLIAPKPTGAPAVGTIQGGYRFKGGDPGSQSSWEKV
jgi:predicted component of type VI protein secretion system